MKRRKLKAALLSLVMCAGLVLPSAEAQAATTLYNNATGNEGGYDYELWKDYGTTSMTLTGGGTFSCSWSNIGNALFRKGRKFDSTKTYQQIGNITFDYGCEYYPNGNSYLCVYGWTKDPLIEYYIVDSWGSWRPPGGTPKAQITVDGGTYDVYETMRYNQPSIIGDTTFKQVFSVRTSKRTSGTISVSEHFKAWERLGIQVGKLYETALNIEGYQSSGQANVYKNNLTVGGAISNNGGNNGGNTGNNNNGGNSNAGNNLVTVADADKIQCENMTKGGQYTGGISSPFGGVALYANNDSVTFTQNFTKGTHDFTLRGCSNNSEMARVDLFIGNQNKGTFYFGDNNPAEYTIKNVSHGTGKQEVKLVVNADDGKWDAYIDWLGIGGISSESGNTNTGNNNQGNTNTGNNNQGNTNTGNTNQGGQAVTGSTIADGWYYIKNVNAQKYLQVANNQGKDGQNVELGTGTGVDGQKWYVKNTGDGYVTIKSATGYMLDVVNGDGNNDTNINIWSENGWDPQKFKISPTSNAGEYGILTKVSNNARGLDAAGAKKTDGTNVLQWDYVAKANQLWVFEPTSGNANTGNQNQGNTNTGNQNQGNTNTGNTGNTNTGNTGSATANNKVQCEDMTKAGQYTGSISSPFSGAALYANNDSVSFSQYFAYDTHSFTLRGCSNNNSMARVDLKIGGQTKGTFYFGDNNPAEYTIDNVKHGTGEQKVELVVTADDGKWDAYVDWLSWDGAGSANTNTNTNNNTNTNAPVVNANSKLVALTFDDGPSSTTSQVLDVLEKYGVPATFFLIGQQVNSNTRAIMERQVSMGCELASHSYTHQDMSGWNATQIRNEMEWTSSAIKNTVGVDVKFFRPPYLATSATMYQNIDYPFIQGITCDDWISSTSSYQRSNTVLNNVQDGTIVLLHDFQGNTQTVDALPAIIEGLKNKGYTFVTVSQLFELKGINPDVEYKIWSQAK